MQNRRNIVVIFFVLALIPRFWAYEERGGHDFSIKCEVDRNYGKFNKKSITLDSLLIEFRVDVTNTLKSSGSDIFPRHKIIATGNIIDDPNRMISLPLNLIIQNAIERFHNIPATTPKIEASTKKSTLKNKKKQTKTDKTRPCKMTFERTPIENWTVSPANLAASVYKNIVGLAESCIKKYICLSSDRGLRNKDAPETRSRILNKIAPMIVRLIESFFKANTTIMVALNKNSVSSTSMTFHTDSKIERAEDLSLKQYGPDFLVLRGYYDITANFSINNFTMVLGAANHERLPVLLNKLQIAFEATLNFTNTTCIILLPKFEYYNWKEGSLYAELSTINKQESSWSVLGWIGSAVDILSNLNAFRFTVYEAVLGAIAEAIKQSVESVEFGKVIAKTIADLRTIFIEMAQQQHY